MASSAAKDISRLHRERGSCKRNLTMIENKIASTPMTEHLAITLMAEVQQIQHAFTKVDHELQELTEHDEEQAAKEEAAAEELQRRLLEMKVKLGAEIQARSARHPQPNMPNPADGDFHAYFANQNDLMRQMVELQRNSASSASNNTAKTKLPQIKLIPFTGQYTDWPRFHDAFKSMIHENPSLPAHQKLWYLKNYMEDSAQEEVSHVLLTDENYEPTWARVQKRFNKKIHLVNSFIDQFMEQAGQKVENATDLKQASRRYRQIFDHLKGLGEDCLKLDVWIIYLMKRNMSQKFRLEWEKDKESEDIPTLEDFFEFMQKQTDVLERASAGIEESHKAAGHKGFSKPGDKDSSKATKGGIKSHLTELPKCYKCGDSHSLYECEGFRAMSVEDRRDLVMKSTLCFNCLRGKHSSKKCTSQSRCRRCDKRHHTLIHQERPADNIPQVAPTPVPTQVKNESVPTPNAPQLTTDRVVTTHHSAMPHRALLPTALVYIRDVRGEDQVCRILIDGGGECTMVTEECAQRLGLPRRNGKIPVTGVGEVTAGYTKGIIQLNITSKQDQNNKIQADAYVMNKVTSLLPPAPLSHKNWTHVKSLMLADPTFQTPGKIDVILGAEYSHEINLPHMLKGNDGEPIAQLTIFGWIVAGKISGQPTRITSLHSLHTQCNLDETLKRFWEIESVPQDKKECYTEEEKMCEEHFSRTHSRDEAGRYVVRLAFKEQHEDLGDSYAAAMSRLQAMERRFTRNPEFHTEYKKFMKEYVELAHMEEVLPGEPDKPDSQKYILPHQAVLRPNSETTKLRVVFDASATTRPHKVSLNDILAVGPVLQDDLSVLLLRYRSYEVAFSGDVEKMYRQVSVAPEDRDYQRILWREDTSQRVKIYRLCTVTYRTSSAPYLATKVLQQMAIDNTDKFPEAANAIKSSFYMDDLLCGASTVPEAKKLRQEIQEILKDGKFSLRKWSSTSSEVLEDVPSEMQALSPEEVTGQSKSITALGLKHNPGTDELSLIIEALPTVVNTKRQFCSASAKNFDPLGFISPVTVRLKIMFQSLWVIGIDWDDPLPEELAESCNRVLSDFQRLNDVRISRCLPSSDGVIELHGFSDASEKAFAAVVYARGQDAQGNTNTCIVMAKSRVAPLKPLSIPRLELNGCLLLAELMSKIKAAIVNKEVKMYAWTDSMVALQWIQAPPWKWNSYVARRTSMIHEKVPPGSWRHVRTADNPADCASRGISPEELMGHNLWFHGPPWLLGNEDCWPVTPVKKCKTNEEKTIPVNVFVSIQVSEVIEDLITHSSSYVKSVRVLAYVMRFVDNLSVKNEEKRKGFLSVSERNSALNVICAHIQMKCFPEEYKCLTSGEEVPKSSKLRKLVPFLDEHRVMRVRGRLENADLSDTTRHQIILPSSHKFVRDLVVFTHEMYLHAGATHTQSVLRAKFWIIGERSLVKGIIRKCVKCVRNRPRLETPLMGNLPAVRVQQCRPFYNTGCDFAGPFQFRSSYLRKSVVTKGYICLFICMATKSVHLEAVTDLSTDKFVAALRRFTSRRGQCGTIYCDNATNFVGATGATRAERLKGIRDHSGKVVKFMSDFGTQFHYIPSYSPTFGGLWERGVGSVKTHLRKVIGETPLTYEEFSTVLTQIEACINSRPLCALSSDVDDLQPLTPAHFLVGHPLTLPPGPDLMDTNLNLLSRWSLIQRFVQHFWRRWHQEYITTLQNRPKWFTSSRNLEVGDLVLVREPNLKPSSWKMARITATHPGQDNIVRVVTIKTQEGVQKRAVNTLAKLPVDSGC